MSEYTYPPMTQKQEREYRENVRTQNENRQIGSNVTNCTSTGPITNASIENIQNENPTMAETESQARDRAGTQPTWILAGDMINLLRSAFDRTTPAEDAEWRRAFRALEARYRAAVNEAMEKIIEENRPAKIGDTLPANSPCYDDRGVCQGPPPKMFIIRRDDE